MAILKKANPTLDEYLNEMMGGIQTALPSNVKTILVTGQQLTPAQVVTQLKGYLSTFTAVATAKGPYTQAVAARGAIEPQARELLLSLRAFVRQQFPKDAVNQAKFGVTLKPKTKATTVTKAAATTKAKATRAKNAPPPTPAAATVVLNDANGNPVTAPASIAPTAAAPVSGSAVVSGK